MNLIWFRRDLRVTDNPALSNACQSKTDVMGVYIATPKTWQAHNMGARQQQWIKQNLLVLQKQLNELNIPLHIFSTECFSDIPVLLKKIIDQHRQ